MTFSLVKTGALAAAVVLATTVSSFASTWAYVDHSTKVRMFHSLGSSVVNWVSEGDHVKVIDTWGGWAKVQIPGQDGWVKASLLDYGPSYPTPWPSGPVSACFSGPYGYMCINP